MAQIARFAGAPKTKEAGVLLKKKIGDKVKKEEILFQIYSKNTQKLNSAVLLAKKINPIGITGKFGEKMIIDRIPSKKIYIEKPFFLER